MPHEKTSRDRLLENGLNGFRIQKVTQIAIFDETVGIITVGFWLDEKNGLSEWLKQRPDRRSLSLMQMTVLTNGTIAFPVGLASRILNPDPAQTAEEESHA